MLALWKNTVFKKKKKMFAVLFNHSPNSFPPHSHRIYKKVPSSLLILQQPFADQSVVYDCFSLFF